MRRGQIKGDLSLEEIRKRMVEVKGKSEFQRWQVLYLIETKRYNAVEIGELVGVSPRTVHQWTYYYNKYGASGLAMMGSGGRRRSLLSLEEERALLDGLLEDAAKGLVVAAHAVRKKAEDRLGHSVSKDYAYDLLHRHGWRKVAPRPIHPKSDKIKQSEYKKNSPNWCPPLYQASGRKIRDR